MVHWQKPPTRLKEKPPTGHVFPRLRMHVLLDDGDTYCTWQHAAANPRDVHPELHLYDFPEGHRRSSQKQQCQFLQDLHRLEVTLRTQDAFNFPKK